MPHGRRRSARSATAPAHRIENPTRAKSPIDARQWRACSATDRRPPCAPTMCRHASARVNRRRGRQSVSLDAACRTARGQNDRYKRRDVAARSPTSAPATYRGESVRTAVVQFRRRALGIMAVCFDIQFAHFNVFTATYERSRLCPPTHAQRIFRHRRHHSRGRRGEQSACG